MPKLPQLKGSECVAALERLGFIVIRQRGSHVVMKNGTRGTVIPMHRELKKGTLHGLLKQGGVDADEFLKALNG